ncbi:hypothetical protein RclHR1_02400014 [Rhizophagus clarus]|uniref:Uncharacterized protein n=1 Tax=Rhizophagus clarus TaxID=94130 RepID=A0A2Z6RRN8_9GLOM|nr:hypothetical protein RclHR1_02400014 [Rhizophagus clarus]
MVSQRYQKNQKTGLPPMKLYLMDMDKAKSTNHPKFNLILQVHHGLSECQSLERVDQVRLISWEIFFLVLKLNAYVKVRKAKRHFYGSRYIACDDLIVCGYHPDEQSGHFSHEDISKIIRRYTDDVKNASMVINSYLHKVSLLYLISLGGKMIPCNPSKFELPKPAKSDNRG